MAEAFKATSTTMYRIIITSTIVWLTSAPLCWSDDATPPPADESLKQVQSIPVTRSDDGSVVGLIETPLLRFGEPTRGNEKGSLWAWGRTGRPLVIAEIYHNTGDQESWIHAISLTSTELITAATPAGRWSPQSVQLAMQPVDGAARPADQHTRRLQQMRQMIRRYTAHQFWDPDNSRYELRLLPSPLHRYEDVEAGIVDGAVFAFAHGTNPEILVFIEAQKAGDVVRWHAGFAPSGSAEMHVTQGDADVWTLPRAIGVTGRPSDPYWLFVTTPRTAEP